MRTGTPNGSFEIRFTIKTWRGYAVLGAIALVACIYYFALPGTLRPEEREALIDKLREEPRTELVADIHLLRRHPHHPALQQQTLASGRAYLRPIEIVSATVPPRGLSLAKRVRVVYTVDGKKPPENDGIRYFRIVRRDEGFSRFDYIVYEIGREEYESFW